MRQSEHFWRWFIWRVMCLALAAIAIGCLLGLILTPSSAAPNQDTAAAWSHPATMAIRRTSLLTGSQGEQTAFNNLDCDPLSYRAVGNSTMQQGCFGQTVFGLFDSDSGMVIFNGTDEALPLLPFTAQQVLVPWQQAINLISLDPVSTGGTYISLYRNPLAHLQDQRDLLGRLRAKSLTAPPDLPLLSPNGQRLVINPQTLAFSGTGSWMVAETLSGSFIRLNLATLDSTAFAPAFGAQGSPELLKSRVAISDNGRFVAIMNNAAASFKVYDLDTCGVPAVNSQPQGCQAYDYYAFARQQISGLQSVRHLRFINEGLLSFEAITTTPATTGIYELAPTATITWLTEYLGLGDSYTSGEGAFDYIGDTDSDTNHCHLSRRSYPLLLSDQLFSAAGGHSVACSGARINDIGSTSDQYRGQVTGVPSLHDLREQQPLLLESVETNFIPGYIAQQRFVKRWQPRLVTVAIGGNDVGFGELLKACVLPHVSRHPSDTSCFSTYEDRAEILQSIDRTVPRWTALYRQLRQESPDSQLYAIGYPQLFDEKGSCALNVHLDHDELVFATGLIAYLDTAIAQAATMAGVTYVDISEALAGHRLCETASYNVAVNGLTAGKDAGPLGTKLFGKESYHPNALGQALIEQAILRQTHNLTAKPAVPAVVSNPALLQVPKTNRPIRNRVLTSGIATEVGGRGSSLAVYVAGVSAGLKPASLYIMHLDGPGGLVLAAMKSDGEGNLNGTVLVPATASSGGHSLDILGENQADEPITITQKIFVTATAADSDDDGTPDTLDTCPGASNSGQDTDQDGLDDTCDSLIGTPPPGSLTSVDRIHNSIGSIGAGSSPGNSNPNTVQTSSLSIANIPVPPEQSRSGQVLGLDVTKSQNGASRAVKIPTKATGVVAIQALPPWLRVIHWRFWLWLLLICWLLVALYAWLLRRILRRRQPA